MEDKVLISEIFESIQGEGPYIGVNQLFIRFCYCNLNCTYCDTDFKSHSKEYSVSQLVDIVNKYKDAAWISLTGGEPLLESDFLLNFLQKTDKKIYLETNGTLPENLSRVINLIDVISMDIKLPSCSGIENLFDKHKLFIECALVNKKEIFLKVVFDENITSKEIEQVIILSKENNLPVILQPKMDGEKLNLTSDILNKVFYTFNSQYQNVRLIPQVHKFLNVR